jgi:hypothetical protein
VQPQAAKAERKKMSEPLCHKARPESLMTSNAAEWRLAGGRIGIPLVPQETFDGTSRWPETLAWAGRLTATHRRAVSKKRRRKLK